MKEVKNMKSAVLVIDVQKALFDISPRPHKADETVKKINQVTAKARSAQAPVIFIQHEAPDSAVEYSSDGWQLESNLVVEDSDLFVRKTTPDSFLRTDLEEILKNKGITHLIICGYATEFCVDTTTRRAAGLGFSVQLVSDAHTTHDKPHAKAEDIQNHHNHTLPRIKSFGVEDRKSVV